MLFLNLRSPGGHKIDPPKIKFYEHFVPGNDLIQSFSGALEHPQMDWLRGGQIILGEFGI